MKNMEFYVEGQCILYKGTKACTTYKRQYVTEDDRKGLKTMMLVTDITHGEYFLIFQVKVMLIE